MKITINLTKDEQAALRIALDVELRRLPVQSMGHQHLKSVAAKLTAACSTSGDDEPKQKTSRT